MTSRGSCAALLYSVPMQLDAASFTQACREGGARIETCLRIVDREHGARFCREAAAVLRCWHAAEDAVQEAMVKAWQRCATFGGQGDPVAWIHQIVRRTVLDALRRRHDTEEPLHDDDGALTPAATAAVAAQSALAAAGPEQQLVTAQAEAVFRRCFARFAQAHPEHAAVLRWVVEDGLGHAELAPLLGRSVGATREYVSQCRKRARPYFADWYALVGAGEATGSAGNEQAQGNATEDERR